MAWAAYGVSGGKSDPVILVAGEVSPEVMFTAGKSQDDDPNEILFEDMAHEYGHHIQYCRGDAEYDEEEATKFAQEAMEKWERTRFIPTAPVVYPGKSAAKA